MAEPLDAMDVDREFWWVPKRVIAARLANEEDSYSVFEAVERDTRRRVYVRCWSKESHREAVTSPYLKAGAVLYRRGRGFRRHLARLPLAIVVVLTLPLCMMRALHWTIVRPFRVR